MSAKGVRRQMSVPELSQQPVSFVSRTPCFPKAAESLENPMRVTGLGCQKDRSCQTDSSPIEARRTVLLRLDTSQTVVTQPYTARHRPRNHPHTPVASRYR
jgi:hypothetical protein